jgi:MYXO-CTERM domain-containing protein
MRDVGAARTITAVLAWTLVGASCGAPLDELERVESGPIDRPGRPYVRPKAMTLQVPLEQLVAGGAVESLAERDRSRAEGIGSFTPFFTPGGAPLPVYLERRAVTYTAGADNSLENRSSVVGSGTRTVGGFRGTDTQWNQIVACVRNQFARFNVEVTDVEPTAGEYVEAHFGGTPGQLGLPNGVGGVAPIDNFSCRIIPRAVVYIFSDVLGNSTQLNCEVAAQEIAHAFSLDHELLCQDPMTYLSGCGAKTFQDIDAQCGEFEPRQCNCGRARHNSVQLMLQKLGPAGGNVSNPSDVVPPTASIVSPANGATLPANTTMQVIADAADDQGVAATELIWDFNGQIFGCPTNEAGGAVTCTRTGNRSTWTLNVGQGSRTFSVRVRDVGGNQVVTPSRTIQLTTGGEPPPPPPNDNVPPVVTMISPQNGAQLLANSIIQVSAQATDDQGLAAVELLWTFSGDTFPCPFQGQAINCAVTGDTYTWSLNVGVGQRAFQVQATDLAGNSSITPERLITLTTDPAPPVDPGSDRDVAEPNDSAAQPFGTRCGTALDVVATPGDDDWYAVEAPVGTDVQVGLTAAAGSLLDLALFRADGTTLLDETGDAVRESLTVSSADELVLARVRTSGSSSVSYRLAIACGTGDIPPPPDFDDDLEPNNTIDEAERSFCGQELQGLAALDDDFYVVSVRQGDTLRVALSNEGATASLLAADGTELAPAGAEASATNLPAGDVYVRIVPAGAGTSYDVRFECSAFVALPPRAAGCACSSSTPGDGAIGLSFLVGLLGVRAIRRRS